MVSCTLSANENVSGDCFDDLDLLTPRGVDGIRSVAVGDGDKPIDMFSEKGRAISMGSAVGLENRAIEADEVLRIELLELG